MKKILCPVNFTDTALNALEYACNLAALHGSALTFFHVITDEEYNRLLEDENEDIRLRIDREDEQLERKLSSLCQESISSYPNIKCDYAKGVGDLSSSIVDFAKSGGYGLIVMGNDGVENVTKAINGSSTIKVVEKSPCAVLSIPSQADFRGFKKLVFGTEFLEKDKEALLQLYLLFKPAASSIHVVHIKKPGGEDQLSAIQHKIDELKTYLNYPKIHFNVREYEEGARLGLHDYMDEINGDLLVLLTHQRNFLERIFQKSISKRISYFADYPILVFLEENL